MSTPSATPSPAPSPVTSSPDKPTPRVEDAPSSARPSDTRDTSVQDHALKYKRTVDLSELNKEDGSSVSGSVLGGSVLGSVSGNRPASIAGSNNPSASSRPAGSNKKPKLQNSKSVIGNHFNIPPESSEARTQMISSAEAHPIHEDHVIHTDFFTAELLPSDNKLGFKMKAKRPLTVGHIDAGTWAEKA